MTVLLEVTAARRPGGDRGVGRYLAALRAAYQEITAVSELVVPMSTTRAAEFVGLAARSVAVTRADYDVFHAPTPYYAALDPRGRPSVTSILDVIPLDLEEHRQTGLKARLFHRLAARSRSVLTLSEHAAGRITDLLGVDPERVVVAPLPAVPAFAPEGPRFGGPAPTGGGRPYVATLYDLRTPDPRKRCQWLPGVAARLRSHGIDLVVVGAGTDRLDLPGVTGLGRLADEEWAAVLRGAQALVYTSAYEGQGMPVLEAISCGAPVVAMDNSAIPEVVGGAGVLVTEQGDDGGRALGDAAARLVLDGEPRARFAEACASQAAAFHASRFVGGVRAAYQAAVG